MKTETQFICPHFMNFKMNFLKRKREREVGKEGRGRKGERAGGREECFMLVLVSVEDQKM
jgi:hypothetical protein